MQRNKGSSFVSAMIDDLPLTIQVDQIAFLTIAEHVKAQDHTYSSQRTTTDMYGKPIVYPLPPPRKNTKNSFRYQWTFDEFGFPIILEKWDTNDLAVDHYRLGGTDWTASFIWDRTIGHYTITSHAGVWALNAFGTIKKLHFTNHAGFKRDWAMFTLFV